MYAVLFYQTLNPITGNNFKKFSLRMSMINTNKYGNTHFAQKWEYNYYKSLVGLTHCERYGYSLACIKYCFHGSD